MSKKDEKSSNKRTSHGYEVKIFRVPDTDDNSEDRIAEVRDILVSLLLLARRKGRPPKANGTEEQLCDIKLGSI